MRIIEGTWYFSERWKALDVVSKASSGVPGAKTNLGKSSWEALMTKCKSPWAVRVGRPVAGPGL